MIARLRGVLLEKDPPRLVLDVGGVGYELWAPMGTCAALPGVGSELTLHTYLYLRPETVQLYGFLTSAERELFSMLLSVSGVGPRSALALLSSFSPAELCARIASSDVEALRRVPGIGRKTAERLVVELRDRLETGSWPGSPPAREPLVQEAVRALMALGQGRREAERAVSAALRSASDGVESLEELIRLALRQPL